MTVEFVKQDLKDGMVLTYRNGERRLLYGLNLYEIKDYKLMIANDISSFNNDLTCDAMIEYDIIKVEYMGDTIWERKEYVTFDVARKSGKRVRYCGDKSILNRRSFDKYELSEFGLLNIYLYNIIGVTYDSRDINKILDDPMWEVEQ